MPLSSRGNGRRCNSRNHPPGSPVNAPLLTGEGRWLGATRGRRRSPASDTPSPVSPMTSRKKYSLCWPSSGAGESRLPGVRESSNSLRSVAYGPISEWSSHWKWSRCRSCGSSNRSRGSLTMPEGTPASCNRRSRSPRSNPTVQAATRRSNSSSSDLRPRKVEKESEWSGPASGFGDLQKPGPLFVRPAGQGNPAVFAGAGVDAVGSGTGIPVAHAALLTAVGGVVQQKGSNEVQGRLKLGQVQVDALAGAAAPIQGREGWQPRRTWGR